jgi:tripartite-type tricarboxylate transporter receptor subunit TctC
MIRFILILACALLAGAHGPVLAQGASGYPTKPVRLVLPYPPGGGVDTLARPLAKHLAAQLGQQVVVENRGGAGGAIGMEAVARSTADGYTLVMAITAQLAVNVSLFRKLSYDPVRDFEPITLLGEGPYLLVVHPSLPAKSVQDLVALARKRPGELIVASSGNGSGGHLAAELLKTLAGIDMLHVPYKGGGPAMIDLISGDVQVLFAPYASSRPQIEAGRMRALAVSTAERVSALPDLPTIAESGVPGYETSVWYGVLAPAGTPRAIVDRLNEEIRAVLKTPDYAKFLARSAIDPVGSPPEVLSKLIKSEIVKWAKVIKDAGVRID